MKMPARTLSPRRLVRVFGLYLLARLGVHPATASLADAWRHVVDTLKAALGVAEAASERQVVARAGLDYADAVLDDAVRAVAAAAKADLGGRAEGADYARLFHVPFGQVVRLPIAQEIEEAKRIEAELASGPVWTSARALLPAFAAARHGVETANAEYRAAVVDSDTADRMLAVAAEVWRNAYRSAFGSLTEKFPSRPTVVEGFFWQEAEGRPSEAPVATPPATA